MARLRSGLVCIGLTIGLTACGIPSPDPSLWLADPADTCPSIDVSAAKADDLFVMSSSLPDCRDGAMTFTTFRSHRGPTFAQAELTGPEGEPARSNRTRRFADEDAWLRAIDAAVSAESGNAGMLAVYFHGYNNTYRDALERGESVRRSFQFAVPTVVVSWPSRARGQSYLYDEASIGWAQQFHSQMLVDLARRASDITLVSHSMGGRTLIQSVLDLDARHPELARHVKRLVIVSPDVDRDRVLRDGGEIDLLSTFGKPDTPVAERRDIVIYASSRDLPIRLSRYAHGYARLGSTSCKYAVNYADRQIEDDRKTACHATHPREKVAIIDTSGTPGLDRDLLRHSDVFESCTGRADLRAFLAGERQMPWRSKVVLDDQRRAWRLVRDPRFEDGDECIDWTPELSAGD